MFLIFIKNKIIISFNNIEKIRDNFLEIIKHFISAADHT
jgi:hypothetical protein